MRDHSFEDRYVIITPVKDESAYILKTILSVVNQTVKPLAWIIIDDGSNDNTAELVRDFLGKYEWIYLVNNKTRAIRRPGSPVITAFRIGFDLVKDLDYDFIVKLDGDLVLEEEYFEKMLKRFSRDRNLGIASGIYLEKEGNGWVEIKMPEYHAAGAAKMVRRGCFNQIGGFTPSPGWDTADEIKAQFLGWRTCHFKDVHFYHLKKEGTGIGQLKTSRMHGEVFYLTGGGIIFFTLKFVHRTLLGKPLMLNGFMMLLGYLNAFVSRKKRLVTRDEARFYRKLLNRRLLARTGI